MLAPFCSQLYFCAESFTKWGPVRTLYVLLTHLLHHFLCSYMARPTWFSVAQAQQIINSSYDSCTSVKGSELKIVSCSQEETFRSLISTSSSEQLKIEWVLTLLVCLSLGLQTRLAWWSYLCTPCISNCKCKCILKKIPHTTQKPITTMQNQFLLKHGSFGGGDICCRYSTSSTHDGLPTSSNLGTSPTQFRSCD